jgi:hypothetical protein
MPRDWSEIVIPYQRRFRDRSVLLHVLVLMTFGDLGPNIGAASLRRPLNSDLILRPAQTISSKRQPAFARAFSDVARDPPERELV